MSNAEKLDAPNGRNSPVRRREIGAWACFDFANSGYTTVVLTTIYSTYFVAVIGLGLEENAPGSATFAWTLSIGAANLLVLLFGPIIGAIADRRASKKRFLLLSTAICVASTALLALAGPAHLQLAIACLILSAIAFSIGENLIGAFLPEIATPANMGRISGYGWSLGYLGGLLTLSACLTYITWAEARGMAATQYVPVCLFITALIFAITASPTFIWLQERATPQPPEQGASYIKTGVGRVWQTLRQTTKLPDLFRFLLCLTWFQSGVATVVVVAAIYAQQVVGFDSQQLIILIMVVNLTAAIGAFGFGLAQDHFGSVNTLGLALLVWIAAIFVTQGADSEGGVWLAGNLMGLAMGATQAGGRALVGQLTPPSRNGEIFGLWGLANRAAAIIGPVTYGVIIEATAGDYQAALYSTLAFFVVGLVLLMTVNEQRGRSTALSESPCRH